MYLLKKTRNYKNKKIPSIGILLNGFKVGFRQNSLCN
jgi:hypothetical protein